MTSKHFRELAETIRFMRVDDKTRDMVIEDMASFCKRQNSNFDYQRFVTACKPSKSKR